MPYYNVGRSAENIRNLKRRQGARKVSKRRTADGRSQPYSDLSGGMTNVRKRNTGSGKRMRIRYDKM